MKPYLHNTGTFIGKGGVQLFFRSWLAQEPSVILVIAHGLGEHSGRYGNIVRELKGKKISIYALDHRGHGKSEGKRGHVKSFMEYAEDLRIFTELAVQGNEGVPVAVLGHSMGAVIALKTCLAYPELFSALIVSSAGLVPALEVPAWKTSLAKILSRRLPGFSLSNGIQPRDLSHDAFAVDEYENDPQAHDRVSARWYTEFTAAGEECLRRAGEFKTPMLLIHGKEDRIVSCSGSEKLFSGASSSIKELRIFEGLYHETMNETEGERVKVLRTISDWLKKYITSAGKTAKTPVTRAAKAPGKSGAAAKKSGGKGVKAKTEKKR